MIFLLLLAMGVEAARRLSGDPCAPSVYILAQGAPAAARGKSWGRGLADPNVDTTGVGTRILRGMPACHASKAVSLRVHSAAEALQAAVWLDGECASRPCLVYSAYELPEGHAYAVITL